jgi:hypothetical protein
MKGKAHTGDVLTPFALSVELSSGASGENCAEKKNHDGQRQAADQSSGSVNEKEKRRADGRPRGNCLRGTGRPRSSALSVESTTFSAARSVPHPNATSATRHDSCPPTIFSVFPLASLCSDVAISQQLLFPIFAPNAPSKGQPDICVHAGSLLSETPYMDPLNLR